MKTRDLIQLLKLTPKMPLKVEYLPGLFIHNGFAIQKISQDYTEKGEPVVKVYIMDKPYASQMETNELFDAFENFLHQGGDVLTSEVMVIYGNEELSQSELDITEVEFFQQTLTLKLYSTNNLKKAKERQERVNKENVEQKGKRYFFSSIMNILFPQPLVLKWNLAKL